MEQIKGLSEFRVKIFKALGDPLRLEIIEFLRDGDKCVCEIVPYLKVVQPLVSRHLKILRDVGIVSFRKEGNRRVYAITDERIFKVIDSLTHLEEKRHGESESLRSSRRPILQ